MRYQKNPTKTVPETTVPKGLGESAPKATGVSAVVVAEVDDAEQVAFRICQHDEIRIIRITVPVDPARSQRHQSVGATGSPWLHTP